MKTIGILQPSYLPWLSYFEQIHHCDVFVLLNGVQYDKGGWRNRNRVKTANGVCWLTVPVKSKGSPPLYDVRIDNGQNWQRKHLDTIKQSYAKSPHLSTYLPGLENILGHPWLFLSNLNTVLINWLCEQLGITTRIVRCSDTEGDAHTRLIKIIHSYLGDRFYEGEAGRDYIDVERFEANGIQVEFQDYKHPVYPQLHGEFVSHLSVIDLLFNCGPESLEILCKQS